MTKILYVKDIQTLNVYLDEEPELKLHMVLVDGAVEYVYPLARFHRDDFDFFYRGVHNLIHNPPEPFSAAGFGFIDNNFRKLDTARFFGSFEVDVWLKPAPTQPPKIFTVKLGVYVGAFVPPQKFSCTFV